MANELYDLVVLGGGMRLEINLGQHLLIQQYLITNLPSTPQEQR